MSNIPKRIWAYPSGDWWSLDQMRPAEIESGEYIEYVSVSEVADLILQAIHLYRMGKEPLEVLNHE